jgi:hypothetical protein
MPHNKVTANQRFSIWIPRDVDKSVLDYLNDTSDNKSKNEKILEALQYYASQKNTLEIMRKELKELFLEYIKSNEIEIKESKKDKKTEKSEQIINSFLIKNFNKIEKL